jgi:hypothetical protein
MGTGTTGVVPLALGCLFVGIDKEDTYENAFLVLLRKVQTKRTTKTNESIWGWSKTLESFESIDLKGPYLTITINFNIYPNFRRMQRSHTTTSSNVAEIDHQLGFRYVVLYQVYVETGRT